MLYNLEKARKDNGVTKVDLADLIGVKYQTITEKIEGNSSFKFEEALIIKETYFPEYDLVYLFSKEEQPIA